MSRWWYVVVVVVGGLSILATLASNTTSYVATLDSLERVSVGRIRYLNLEPGTHTIYLEREYGFGRYDEWAAEEISILGPGRTEIDKQPYPGMETYDWWGRRGVAVMTFEVERSGFHRIAVGDTPNTLFGPQSAVIVEGDTQPFLERDDRGARVGIAGMSVSGATLVIVAVLRRRKAARPAPDRQE